MLFDPSDADAFWLDVTNAALGVFCLACLVAIGWGLWREWAYQRRRRSIHVFGHDPHALLDPTLGTSMADGGQPIDATNRNEKEKASRRDSEEE